MSAQQQSLYPPQKTFGIGSILNKAWSLTDGIKWPVWAVFLCLVVTAFIVMSILNWVFGVKMPEQPPSLAYELIAPVILNAITAPFYTGALMVTIKKARGDSINPSSGFQYFNKYIPLAITLAIIGFLMRLPMFILNISASGSLGASGMLLDLLAGLITLVLFSFLMLAVPLVADRNLGIAKAFNQAIKFASYKLNWLKIACLLLISYLIFFVIMLPILLGVIMHNWIILVIGIAIFAILIIWIVPYLVAINGLVYHKLCDS